MEGTREKRRKEEKGRGGREEEGKYVLKIVPFFPKKLGEVVLALYQTGCSLHKSLW